MKGRAPKSPETGSQVFVRQKLKPNFAIESRDSCQRTKAIPATRSTTSAAKKPVPARNPRSPLFRCGAGLFDIACSGVLELDLTECLHLEGDDLFRKRRVAEAGAVLLSVGDRPLEEVDHDLRARLVARVLVEEHPGEGRDRVGVRPRRVRDRD